MKRPIIKLTIRLATAWLLVSSFVLPSIADDEVPSPPSSIRGDNPDIGIKYDKKQGLFVTPFSAKLLGFEMVDVEEKEISGTLTLQAQVFDVSPEGKALASAWLPLEDAEKLSAGTLVTMERGYKGKVVSVASKLNQQGEVLLEIEDAEEKLKAGKFLSGEIEIHSDGEVVVVPKDSVVNSSEGAFAYVDNGGWTVRTKVEVGAEQAGMVEIVDGLYAGDVVVTSPVMTLWMTELQLLKSGRA